MKKLGGQRSGSTTKKLMPKSKSRILPGRLAGSGGEKAGGGGAARLEDAISMSAI